MTGELLALGDDDLFARVREQTSGGAGLEELLDELQLRLCLCRRSLLALTLGLTELARGTGELLQTAHAAAETADPADPDRYAAAVDS